LADEKRACLQVRFCLSKKLKLTKKRKKFKSAAAACTPRGSYFFEGEPANRRKNRFLTDFTTEICKISVKSGEGTNEARAQWAKPRGESPMSKEVRQANAMTDDHCELWVVVARDERSARPVGETARRESNKQRSTASLATLGDYCALRNVYFPVHQSGKILF